MGEIHEFQPRETAQQALEAENAELHRQLAGAEAEVRSWRTKYALLKEELDIEAEEDPNWPLAMRIFIYHGRIFHHERAEWTPKRFRMLSKRLKQKDGLELCLKAIAGLRTDAWRLSKHLTTFEDVFGSEKNFDTMLARCPKNWQPPPGYEA